MWTGWSGPKWSSIFSFIPGQAGLLKVLDKKQFQDQYYELAAYSVTDAIYIPKNRTEEIRSEVMKETWRANFEKFVRFEPISFLLFSEADETINQNGKAMYIYDYCFGSELSEELKKVILRKMPDQVPHD